MININLNYILNWFQKKYAERIVEPIIDIQKDKKRLEEKDTYIKNEVSKQNEEIRKNQYCKELGASGLLDEGLNENQIRQVMLWCQNECQKGWAQNQYEPHYNLDSLDIYDPKRKEKTLQSVYDDMIPSPYKELSHRGFRT